MKNRIPTRLDLQMEKIFERWLGRQIYKVRYFLLGALLLFFSFAGWVLYTRP